MAQENVEIIRSAYAEPDPLTTFAAQLAPDAEFDFTAVYPDRPILRGVEEIRRFRAEGPWGPLSFEPERFFDVDAERVLVFVRALGTGKLSGVPGEARVAHEFTFRNGLLVRFKVYRDREEALKAAGLWPENVDAVRRVLETTLTPHFSDADLERLFHPDVHLDLTVREINPATYDGFEGVRQFVRDLFEIWEEFSVVQPFELLPAPDNRVLAIHTMRGRGGSSGVVVEMPVYNVYTVRAGKVAWLKSYRDRSAALEAVGLG